MHAFNFEFVNDAMTKGRQPRITSYFSNSVLSKQDGPAAGRVASPRSRRGAWGTLDSAR